MRINLAIGIVLATATFVWSQSVTRFPADKATDINPDTHLVLKFASAPTTRPSGQIRIYDAADDKLIDMLDMSIPPSIPAGRGRGPATYSPTPYPYVPGRRMTNANTVPGTPSGVAEPTSRNAQLTIIGGFTDGFRFHPIIIHDNTATIYPHNNLLDYNKTYYVQIDPSVFSDLKGFAGKTDWTFSTKKAPPSADSARLVVASDGSGDFNTVQGAIDFIPDKNPKRVTVFVKNGDYEEIVYFRNKTNITILGEDREKTAVFYANNEVFNPHPPNVSTNEWPGTFPSRRAAFMVDNCSDIHLVNLTIKTTLRGQAEGLLITGERNIVSNVNVMGSGDALQVNGPVYLVDSQITGDGDTILGRGPAFFDRCRLVSAAVYMWIRNTSANHGNIFLNCVFDPPRGTPTIARAPTNGGRNYPDAEVVLLNCSLGSIAPEGWGAFAPDPSNVRLWEYNSTNISDGKPVDVSKRNPISKQLTKEKDAETIANYSNPAYVLGGWTPAMEPIVLAQPIAVTTSAGQTATFSVHVAAVPTATYQWFKNGSPINGATDATLKLQNIKAADAGSYTVTSKNASGTATSNAAALVLK